MGKSISASAKTNEHSPISLCHFYMIKLYIYKNLDTPEDFFFQSIQIGYNSMNSVRDRQTATYII